MFKFRRLVAMAILILLCMSFAGCTENTIHFKCSECGKSLYLNYREDVWYSENDPWVYNCKLEAFQNHYSYEGTISGDATGVLVLFKGSLSGSISEKETYDFFAEMPDGGIKKFSVPYNVTKIYYSEDPHVEFSVKYEKRYTFCPNCGGVAFYTDYGYSTDYSIEWCKLYAPKDSIRTEYKAN